MSKILKNEPFESFDKSVYTKVGHVIGKRAAEFKPSQSEYSGPTAVIHSVYDYREEHFKDAKTTQLTEKKRKVWELHKCDVEYYPEDVSDEQVKDPWSGTHNRSYHFVCIEREEEGGAVKNAWVFRERE